ncbi:MAG: PIN domain-containing protein [Pirellulaceae bacterium]|nr:PIN domain-containing protein [Pirellulaceae bacterium]
MTVYLLDTHVLFWHLFAPAKLSAAARQAVADGETGQARLVVSHLVLAELFFLLKKLGQEAQFPNIVAAIRGNATYSFDPIVLDDIENLSKYPAVAEMHDRLLVIQANRLCGTLISKDQNIQASPQVKWLW